MFAQPNRGPFLATRLIRSLVTRNPTPAHVQRVAAVFNNNRSAVRGDWRAVVRAIRLDAEARQDTAGPSRGRPKNPVFHIPSLLRALGGSITATHPQAWCFSRLAETPLVRPAVFSVCSPLFRVPQSTLARPEF